MDDQSQRPLPRTQARMADLIEGGQVAYNPDTAKWYLSEDVEDVAVKGDGRALREMHQSGLLRVVSPGRADTRGAFPVELSDSGRARHRR